LPLALKEKLSVLLSLLVSVTVFAVEVWPTVTVPNESVDALRLNGKLPVPLCAIVWGESGALSLMASDPVIDPEIAGLKFTFTVHDAPAASDDPQVLLATAKSPVAVMEFTVTLAVPLFFSVTDLLELVVFTSCELKLRVCGVGVTMGALATTNGSAL
jgi:hypothetical protein